MLADALGGDALEGDAAGLRAIVMAGHAVMLLDGGELLRSVGPNRSAVAGAGVICGAVNTESSLT